ncbi:MAG: fimbria major subunit [Bacteroidaceae bacterium]
MKKLFLFAMAVAALSACSNSEDVDIQSEVKAGGEGYVGFSIQLPTTASATRVNDEFDDGEQKPDEYKVHNATMFIFKGSSEANATFVNAYEMNVNTFQEKDPSNDQCTTEGIVSSKITKPETNSGENIYAYVMINSNDMINTTDKTIDGNSYDGITFENFSKLALSNIGDLSNGMVMTNAPVASKVGGISNPSGATITTLTELAPSKIYATQAAAEADPAGNVYMERAAVKVTVKTSSSISGTTSTGNVKYNKASIKWALNNENTKYYNTRQMKESWLGYHAQGDGSNTNIEGTPTAASLYRFVSGEAIHTDVCRTYWGEDLNYTVDAEFTNAPSSVDKEPNSSVYTFENTFDVDHQVAKNTTGVAVSATFNDGKSFYTASTYGDNKILQVPEDDGGDEKIQDYIMTYLRNNYSKFKTWYDANDKNRITVTMDNATVTDAKVSKVEKTADAQNLPSNFGATEIKAAVDKIIFKYYEKGVAYYNVLIKHFGDSETPWKPENHSVNNIDGVYKSINGTALTTNPSPEDNYLGRYGVLRNNWYQIEITGIRQIGSPVPVDPSTDPDPDPDDNVDNYLSVKIHITPWALRKQSVEL